MNANRRLNIQKQLVLRPKYKISNHKTKNSTYHPMRKMFWFTAEHKNCQHHLLRYLFQKNINITFLLHINV